MFKKNRCPISIRVLWVGCAILLLHSCSLVQKQMVEDSSALKRENIDSLTNTCWEERVDNADLATILGEDALSAAERIDYPLGIGQSCKCLASIHSRQKKYVLADSLLLRALAIFEAIDETELSAQTYLQIGNVKLRKESREAGLEWYLKGLAFAEANDLGTLRASFKIAIAQQKARLKNKDEADQLYRETIAWQETHDVEPHQIGNSYYNYGVFLARIKSFPSAIKRLQQAQDIFEKLEGYKHYYAMVLNSLGGVERKLGNVEKAKIYFDQCLNIRSEVTSGAHNDLSYEFNNIGDWHLRRKNLETSEAFFSKSVEMATQAKDHRLMAKAHRGLAYVHSRKEDWEKAYHHIKRSYVQRDSSFNLQQAGNLASLLSRHEKEVAQKETEKSKAETKQLKSQQLLLWSLVAFLLLGLYFIRQNMKHKQDQLLAENEIRANNARADGQEVERKRIADALHDSMGTKLAALKMNLENFHSVKENTSSRSEQLLGKITHRIDESISYNQKLAYQLLPPTLSKFGLPAALLSLKDRMESPGMAITVSTYGMEQRLPEKLELSMYRTTEELLKNVIRHSGASEVNIQLTEHDLESFNLIVEDNGRGFIYDPSNPDFGIGLSNIKSRVQHFNGTFEVDSTPGIGTTIILDIPYPKEDLVTA